MRMVGLLIVAACGSSPPKIPRVDSPIVVLDAGAEPRRVIRREPALHVAERSELTMKLHVVTDFTNTTLENGHQEVDVPGIKLTARLEALGDGVISYQLDDAVVLDDFVDQRVHDQLAAQYATLKGLRGTMRMSPAGAVSESKLVAPSASRAQVASMIEPFQSPEAIFPDVAIGVGASWRRQTRQTTNMVTWDQTLTYTLRDLSETTAVVDVAIEGTAPPQAISVEPTASMKLTSGTTSGTVEMQVSLQRLVSTFTHRVTSESKYSIVRKALRITSTVRTETVMAAKPL